ncbi:MAG TPA: hypothetical protein VNE58_13360 [Casimicrobiaceae bacterium]|nr:hypothetical protein [Casimicrobiaceae bacterium]
MEVPISIDSTRLSSMASRGTAQNGRVLGLWMQAGWDPRRYVSEAMQNFVDALFAHTRTGYPGKSFGEGAPDNTQRAQGAHVSFFDLSLRDLRHRLPRLAGNACPLSPLHRRLRSSS